MQKKLTTRLVLLLFCALLLSSCSKRASLNGEGISQGQFRRSLIEEETARSASEEDWRPRAQSAAQYSYLRAELALQNDELEEAIEFFEQAVKQDPKNSTYVSKRLAFLYIRTGDLDQSLLQIDKVLNKELDNREFLLLRAGILSSLQKTDEAIETYEQLVNLGLMAEEPYLVLSSLHADRKDFSRAQKVLKQLVKKSSQSFLGLFYLAKMYEADKQYTFAEVYYEKALKLSPKSRVVTLSLARTLGFAGKFERAIKICQDMLALEPKNPEIKKLLSQLLLGENRFEEAQKQLEELDETDSIETRLKIALIKLQQRDFEGAVIDFSLILAEDRNYSPALYYIASAYAGLKNNQAAIEALKAIRSEQEFFLESRTFLSFLYKEDERYEDSVGALKDILKIRPKNPRVYSLIVAIYRQAKDTEKAVENLEELISLEPKEDKHHFLLGVVYDEANNKQKAIAAMERAIEINPNNSNALNYLAYTYAELGENLIDAEKLIKRALEIEPGNAYFIDSLAWIYYQQDKYELALKELERAVELVKDDAVILEHYALALEKVGQKSRARAVAEQGLEYVASSDDKDVGARLKSFIRKLQEIK